MRPFLRRMLIGCNTTFNLHQKQIAASIFTALDFVGLSFDVRDLRSFALRRSRCLARNRVLGNANGTRMFHIGERKHGEQKLNVAKIFIAFEDLISKPLILGG